LPSFGQDQKKVARRRNLPFTHLPGMAKEEHPSRGTAKDKEKVKTPNGKKTTARKVLLQKPSQNPTALLAKQQINPQRPQEDQHNRQIFFYKIAADAEGIQ